MPHPVRPRTVLAALTAAAATAAALAVVPPTQASDSPSARAAVPRELSETTRLAERRSLVVGRRFFEMGAEDGRYPATGFHTRGEMGGFWTPPIKLLDGLWFKAGSTWLTSSRYTSGWGYQRMDLGTHDGVAITRTDFVPGSMRAGLVRLRLDSPTATTLDLSVDAHSELMKVYPWGETKPTDQRTYNLADTGKVRRGALLFQEQGTPPATNAERHDYAAVVGSTLTPASTDLGPDHRGPQDPAVICPASGPDAPTQPAYCDDTEYGKGTGGALHYRVRVPAGGRTVWFAVAGSDNGAVAARRSFDAALDRPGRRLDAVLAARQQVNAWSRVAVPGDRLLERSIAWSKQNLAESVQQARDLKVRVTHAGTVYPAPKGTVARADWIGAGWPDYPWLFATDGEYTGFASVASGQFAAIERHLKALRDVSRVANGRSGKIVHEVTPDGQVYFGANGDEGNTDETAKFPSAVALVWRWTGDDGFRDAMYPASVRAMRYIFRVLDRDGDLWPEGLGNVERPCMGEEKLDNTVYTIRGLRDLADLAASKGDTSTRRWANRRAAAMQRRFDKAWWYNRGTAQYADSLDDPGNEKVFQRHWIGVTPAEAELRMPNGRLRPVAPTDHARALVAKRQESCYSGKYGLFHTGTGATTDPGGNKGATCDSAVSTRPAERSVFTLNTSIIAVAEAALGRMRRGQVQRWTTDNAQVQLDRSVWELPGAMPEIAPSPDFGANIDKLFTERSSALQAWGTYGVLWPVVHYQLGVSPDVGRHRLRVVPDIPDGQHALSVSHLRLGRGWVDVETTRGTDRLRTEVSHARGLRLVVGAVLPPGRAVKRVRLDGERSAYVVVRTPRGREVRVAAGRARHAEVVVVLR
jgi:hypothetical protein